MIYCCYNKPLIFIVLLKIGWKMVQPNSLIPLLVDDANILIYWNSLLCVQVGQNLRSISSCFQRKTSCNKSHLKTPKQPAGTWARYSGRWLKKAMITKITIATMTWWQSYIITDYCGYWFFWTKIFDIYLLYHAWWWFWFNPRNLISDVGTQWVRPAEIAEGHFDSPSSPDLKYHSCKYHDSFIKSWK